MASQLSGDLPSALESRKAISGLTPLRPLSNLPRVEAATSNLSDNSLPVIPFGIRYTSETNSPGCGGLCMLVIVFIIQNKNVSSREFKCEAPISVDRDRPATIRGAPQWVQAKARNVHISDDGRSIKCCQLHAKSSNVRRLNPCCRTAFKKLAQALVLERPNHFAIIACCATRYGATRVQTHSIAHRAK